MRCPNCGYEIKNNSHKCLCCGYEFKSLAVLEDMDESGRGERGDYTEIDAKSVYMGRISGQNRGGIFSDLFGGFGFSGGSLFNGMFGSVGNIVSEMFGDFFDIAPGPDNSGGFEGEEYRDFDEYEYDAFGDLVKKKEPATKIILDAERIDADDDGKLK